jgi:hypothetical protein
MKAPVARPKTKLRLRVGPTRFPVIQISLGVFQALKALPFERRLLRMPDAGFDFTFAIRVLHPAWQSYHAIVLEHVTLERIERWFVDIGREHAFAQIIEHHRASDSAQPAKRLLMQLGPIGYTSTSERTTACPGTCPFVRRAPWVRCHNRPALLRRVQSQ